MEGGLTQEILEFRGLSLAGLEVCAKHHLAAGFLSFAISGNRGDGCCERSDQCDGLSVEDHCFLGDCGVESVDIEKSVFRKEDGEVSQDWKEWSCQVLWMRRVWNIYYQQVGSSLLGAPIQA